MSADTLTVVDNRTGAEYTLPIVDGAVHATELGKIKGSDGEGLVSYDRDHLHRRRRGDPSLPRLPDRAGGRAGGLPRDRLPAVRG